MPIKLCLNVIKVSADASGNVGAAVQVSSASQAHFVGASGQFFYYPAISVDNLGNAYVVFDASSTSTFESVQVATVPNGGSTASAFTVLHTSAAAYTAGNCPSGCRWGDYSGAYQDPDHPTDVWVVSETFDQDATCPLSPTACWNTFIARMTLSGPVINALTPAAGPTAGGQSVTASGSDFLPGTTASFAGSPIVIANLTPDQFTFTTPAHAAGLVNAQVTTSIATSPLNAGSGYIYTPLSSYVKLKPFRIADTRSHLCGANSCSRLSAGTVLTLQISGYTDPQTSESVPASAAAVVLNVTAVGGSSFSLFTVWPHGTGQPLASNLNFTAGGATPNLVTVTLGQSSSGDTQRELDIFNALGTVDLVADVEGYFASPSGTAGEFHAMPPLRVCDTRAGQPANVCNGNGANAHDAVLGPGQSVKVNVSGKPAGVGGTPLTIPSDGTAEAAVLNLTAVAGSSYTYLTVFPTSANGSCAYGGTNGPPPSSTINVSAGIAQANRVFAQLGPDTNGGHTTDVCVYNSLGTINFILDANGWFSTTGVAGGKQFQPIGPTRVCDTRSGSGTPCAGHTIAANTAQLVAVTGHGGIPSSGPVAIIANLTAVAGTQYTFLATYPADVSRPNTSDINVSAQQVLPNLVVVQLSMGAPVGSVDVYNSLGSINAILDVGGWFQ